MGIETIALAAAPIAGSFLQADAAKSAARDQKAATDQALGEQARQFNLSRSDQLPFLETGQAATMRLRDLLGLNGGSGSLLNSFNPGDLTGEPGYQFGLSQGNKAIENAARSRGMYMSPSTVKELMRYGQDYAGSKYGEAFNRDLTNRTTTYNMLSGAGGGGQVAANTLTGAGQNYSSNVGNLVTAGANARGAAGIAGANAFANGANTIGNFYMQNKLINGLQNRNTYTPYYTGYGAGGDPAYG